MHDTITFRKDGKGIRLISLLKREISTDSVTRYVPTYINRDGMRTLVRNMQGRDTFATEALALEWMDWFLAGNSKERLIGVFGLQAIDTFEVRPVECYPGHFDPKTCWFD